MPFTLQSQVYNLGVLQTKSYTIDVLHLQINIHHLIPQCVTLFADWLPGVTPCFDKILRLPLTHG